MYEQDRLMACSESAKYLGVTPDTLGVYRTKGIGPKYIKIGRVVRYRVSDVRAWLDTKARTKIFM
jgi:predicted DNA-binding transcriptional regulator AlpA